MNNDQELLSWREVGSPLQIEGRPHAKAQRHFTRTGRGREGMVERRLGGPGPLKRLESKGRRRGMHIKN